MENIEQRFLNLEKKIDTLTEQVTKGFEFAEKKFDSLEEQIEGIKDGSTHTMGTIEKEIKEGFASVLTELRKINTATQYEDKFKDIERFGQA